MAISDTKASLSAEVETSVRDFLTAPPWPIYIIDNLTDNPESAATSEAVVSTHGGSEYVPVGAMSGQYGNSLVVYLDKWGGDGANYLLAARLPLFEADTSENFEFDNFEYTAPTCNTNCTVEVPGIIPIPEVGTIWMAGLAMILILGSRWLQKAFTRSI